MSKELLEQAQWAKDTMIGKKFQNLKTSGIYYVTNITIDTEILELRVVYSDGKSTNDWDRPLTLFIKKFKQCD